MKNRFSRTLPYSFPQYLTLATQAFTDIRGMNAPLPDSLQEAFEVFVRTRYEAAAARADLEGDKAYDGARAALEHEIKYYTNCPGDYTPEQIAARLERVLFLKVRSFSKEGQKASLPLKGPAR